jgi:putative ABC transport system permease protein
MLENISLAFQGIWGHKLRSFLTMLGIIIGIASIIIIVSTIKGTNEQIKANLVGSGTNVVNVQLYQGDYAYDMEYSAAPQGVAIMTEDTRTALSELDSILDATIYTKRTYVYNTFYGNTAYNGSILGVDSHYFSVCGYRLSYGRNFIQSDFDNRHKVAILDATAVTSLMSGINPIGQTIEINGEPFIVIGVVDQTSHFTPTIETLNDYYTYMGNSSGSIYIPGTTWPVVYKFDEPQSAAVKATSTDDMTAAGKNAADYLTENLILTTDGDFSYKSEDLLEQAKQLQELSASTNRQLIWIASVSLLVGGIGVMNIMLVSVTERTSEIGLKKAIGAKRRRILWQFLTEAAVMTSLGGIIGVVAGIGIAQLVSAALETPSAISIIAIIIAVVFSMLIGVVFGLIPAVKASKLNPIEALHRE